MGSKLSPAVVRFEVAVRCILSDALATASALSKTAIKDAMSKGAVWLKRPGKKEQRVRKACSSLLPGDRVSLYYDPDILAIVPPQPAIIALEKYYSIWLKPAGLLSQGSRYGDHCSLLRIAEKTPGIAASARLIHRLDREASGLVLLAHGRQAAARFSHMFQAREMEKKYMAEIHGFPGKPGDILTCDAPLDGKNAETTVKVLNIIPARNTSLVEILLETGRYHQIRRHLSQLGHPLVGDRRYGYRNEPSPLRLQAFSLAFTCPFSGKRQRYVVDPELPDDCFDR